MVFRAVFSSDFLIRLPNSGEILVSRHSDPLPPGPGLKVNIKKSEKMRSGKPVRRYGPLQIYMFLLHGKCNKASQYLC